MAKRGLNFSGGLPSPHNYSLLILSPYETLKLRKARNFYFSNFQIIYETLTITVLQQIRSFDSLLMIITLPFLAIFDEILLETSRDYGLCMKNPKYRVISKSRTFFWLFKDQCRRPFSLLVTQILSLEQWSNWKYLVNLMSIIMTYVWE